MQLGALEFATLIVLAINVKTRVSGVPGGDAGELLAEACNLGTPHPPGYPLFTLLSYSVIQLGKCINLSPADSVNLLCCTLGAVAFYFVGSTTKLIVSLSNTKQTNDKGAVAGVFAGFLFSLSPLTWEYSTGTEVSV